ncbi:hypothetical protein WME91_28045 [Sorangium sp. So ce269]
MGQRTRILTEILGFNDWKVREAYFEDAQRTRFEPLAGYGVLPETRLVLRVERRWAMEGHGAMGGDPSRRGIEIGGKSTTGRAR